MPHECGHGHKKVEKESAHCHDTNEKNESEHEDKQHNDCCSMPCCHIVLDKTNIHLKINDIDYQYTQFFNLNYIGYLSLDISNIFRPPIS